MHKCVNNTVGNVYHLEQMVDNFFPYSQKQLGFDKPATIVFQSDEDNASRMLGKTAYYDPEAFEVVLYTDGRHPKDVMRSLSHELVHHAQNCRGDFTSANSTEEGYAQNDPHLRKMEREAYTKGNLIFRDFEDLIKTGKINIEIDFSDSGEPKMSLKEWKNNEINTKLMKKWGLLTENKEEVTTEGECPEHGAGCGCPDIQEEGWGYRDEDDLDERQSRRSRERESANQRGNRSRSMKDAMGLEEVGAAAPASTSDIKKALRGREKSDVAAQRRRSAAALSGQEAPVVQDLGDIHQHLLQPGNQAANVGIRRGVDIAKTAVAQAKPAAPRGGKAPEHRVRAPSKGSRSARKLKPPGKPVVQEKISVREAKKITQRIIERIKKEGK